MGPQEGCYQCQRLQCLSQRDRRAFDHASEDSGSVTIGVADAYRGETVKVFVVTKQGQTMTEEEVIDFCKEKLAGYKVPKLVEFIAALPKSVVGKILRRELRDMEAKKREGKISVGFRFRPSPVKQRRAGKTFRHLINRTIPSQ